MLNFKNFLKENPEDSQDEEKLNNSFCSTNNQQIEKCLSQKSISWESESKENASFNINLHEKVWQPTKSIKKKRGNKKDDFDYDKYIKQELKKLNLDGKNKKEKKRIIQKIRNRMSAQRSRIRQKLTMDYLQEENQQLKYQKEKLMIQMQELLNQKRISQDDLSNVKIDKGPIKVKYYRQEKKNYNFTSTKPLLFFLGFMLVMCLFYQKDIQRDSMVKMGGFSYLSDLKYRYGHFFRNFNSNHLNYVSNQSLLKKLKSQEKQKKSLIISQIGVSRKLQAQNLQKYVENYSDLNSLTGNEFSIEDNQLFIS